MGRTRKTYDIDFIREAVRLGSEPGVSKSEVEKDLGLYPGAINRWKRELKEKLEQPAEGSDGSETTQAEVKRLRRENERLKRERDILKKAAAYFSMDAIVDSRS